MDNIVGIRRTNIPLSAFKYAKHSIFSIPMQLGAASHNAPLSFNGIQTDNIDQYWSQKLSQNGNIHSTKLDVYVEKQSMSVSLIFYPNSNKEGNFTLSLLTPSQLVRTGTIREGGNKGR